MQFIFYRKFNMREFYHHVSDYFEKIYFWLKIGFDAFSLTNALALLLKIFTVSNLSAFFSLCWLASRAFESFFGVSVYAFLRGERDVRVRAKTAYRLAKKREENRGQ